MQCDYSASPISLPLFWTWGKKSEQKRNFFLFLYVTRRAFDKSNLLDKYHINKEIMIIIVSIPPRDRLNPQCLVV